MQVIVNLAFYEKMFKLQQTVTPCHTGHFSQAFFLFLTGSCQEHELYLVAAPSHLPKCTSLPRSMSIQLCLASVHLTWNKHGVAWKETWKAKASGFSHINLCSPPFLISHLYPFSFPSTSSYAIHYLFLLGHSTSVIYRPLGLPSCLNYMEIPH